MTRLRLIPVLVFGLVSLLTIKVLGFAFDTNAGRKVELAANTGDRFARTIERARTAPQDETIITGSTSGQTPPAKDTPKAGDVPKSGDTSLPTSTDVPKPKLKSEPEGVRLPPPGATLAERGPAQSQAERELLEKLRDRRGAIDARDRELEMRDQLLRQTERKIDEKIGHLRTLEAADQAQNVAKNDPKQRYKPLVVMYENMKPKEAARVFDRLDVRVLLDLVNHMNPRKVSEIVAVMEPASAERLTVAMARIAAQSPDMGTKPSGEQELELPRLPTPQQPRR